MVELLTFVWQKLSNNCSDLTEPISELSLLWEMMEIKKQEHLLLIFRKKS
jgi:hypothetical protein